MSSLSKITQKDWQGVIFIYKCGVKINYFFQVINAGGDYDGSAAGPQNPREAREQMHDGDKPTNKSSTAPSETSKTEYGSVQEQEDKVPENFSDEEISDASSVDNP